MQNQLLQLCMAYTVFSILFTVRLYTVMPEVCRWLTIEKRRKTDTVQLTKNKMLPQTNLSWRDYRALNQNWSYQPKLASRAISDLNSET